MTVCKYPGCDHEEDSRPYSRKGLIAVPAIIDFANLNGVTVEDVVDLLASSDGPESATQVIDFANLGSKADCFAWAAAEVAATFAVHEVERLWSEDSKDCKLSHKICMECGQPKDVHPIPTVFPSPHKFKPGLCSVCTMVRYEFNKRWNAKAARGNHIHHLAVNWTKGEPITYGTELDPYFDDLELFYKRYRPKWLYVERTIHYKVGPREYVGTFDAIAEIDCPICTPWDEFETHATRCTWLLDIKTGDKWMLEWMLQLSAYRWAKKLTDWVEGQQLEVCNMPPVAHTGVIWLGSGTDDVLVPVETTGETHNQFLRLVDGLNWEKRETKALKALDKEKNDVRV